MGEKNRAKAIEQMRKYCGPNRAKLLSEDSKAEFTGQSHSNTSYSNHSAYTSTSQDRTGYVYLHSKCLDPRAKIQAGSTHG